MLTAACLCLCLSQGAGDAYYTNQRNHAIPVNVPDALRAEYIEFRLFSSTDQGQKWQQAGVIPASKKEFAYYAPGDGMFWFQVATVNRQGVQEPDDKSVLRGAPHLKMVIDTVKPIVKSLQAQRFGDDIYVNWDLQDANLDVSKEGIRLEYRVKDELIETWKPVPVTASPKGVASFKPGDKQPLLIRVTVRDLAGNQSFGQAEVAGAVAAAGFNAQTEDRKPPVGSGPGPLEIKPLANPGDSGLPKIDLPKSPIDLPKFPPSDLPKFPPSELPKFPPVLVEKGDLPRAPSDFRSDFKFPDPIKPPVAAKEGPDEKVIADSRKQPGEAPPPPPPITPDPGLAPKNGRKPLPMVQYVNQHLVKLQYEIKRHGPSGIGGVEIWLTKDDGHSWEPYAKVNESEVSHEATPGRQERDFEFVDERGRFPDGVYGLNLVVKNRAGLGRIPKSGDAPEIRIEIDTEKPFVQLLEPMADPQNPGHLLLKWHAADRNLTATPINLEYADKLDGLWQPIKLDLPNAGRSSSPKATGDFSWKVPAGTPVQVYLRVRVRDKAGNEGIAATPTPQFVDLVEPEGSLLGVLPQNKR
jgi:hypothetical protein